MLSKHIKLNNNCELCKRLKLGKNDSDFLFDEKANFYVYKSPLSDRWPGALMVVYKKHIFEQSQIRNNDLSDTLVSLVCLEKTILNVTSCERINFVKFSNKVKHLHWHLIPRYRNECYPSQTSWELLNFAKEKLYKKVKKDFFNKDSFIYNKIIDCGIKNIKSKPNSLFGCALFLRPSEVSFRKSYLNIEIDEVMKQARENPKKWECLLMKRNYSDFSWDFVGGNADPLEFPKDTMVREVFEELGWKIKRYKEVTRQWKGGAIKGFIYLAIPESQTALLDDPPRIDCDEVQTVKYFNLIDILDDHAFPYKVKDRISAFINCQSDFHLTEL
jgi:diadenosine tetraphosphate (Ap4A) HIT family hydrolase/8-oxo-dGTP pyrophosphatase MutT (NUDIX family)